MSEEKHGLFKVGQNIIFSNNNRELLIVEEKHTAQHNPWGWPGGRLHERENWEQGLRREIKEELGINDFKITGIHRVYISSRDVNHYTVEFLGELPDKIILKPNLSEILGFAWVSLKNINNFVYQHEGIKSDIEEIMKIYA